MKIIEKDIVVIGSGPGGYAAAFYAADQGRKVTLVELDPQLGGVCLNRGCIPSKALLHATEFIRELGHSEKRGVKYSKPKIDLKKLKSWKDSIVAKLNDGVSGLSGRRGVEVIYGRGHFEGDDTLRVETKEGQQFLKYNKAIVAVGSRPAIPAAFDLGNPRIMTSTEALELEEIPKRLLVVGGGYIGLELGTVYASLGSEIVLVEAMDKLMAGADADLVRPVQKYAETNFKEVRLGTKVQKMATKGAQIEVTFALASGEEKTEKYDRVLVAVGRKPNSDDLGLKSTDVQLDEKGFIKVDEKQQTQDPNILAIGDIAGGILLAHKASKEARVAVDAILGESVDSREIIIPAVVFTDPEVAWCGLTEAEAKEKGISVKVVRFPWGASGRALTYDRPDGTTKLIIEPETERILGVGIVGHGAGELIAEGVVLVEMGATAYDLAHSTHPHPTLSETMMEAAEMFYGTATHTFTPKK